MEHWYSRIIERRLAMTCDGYLRKCATNAFGEGHDGGMRVGRSAERRAPEGSGLRRLSDGEFWVEYWSIARMECWVEKISYNLREMIAVLA
jgi:hypothetical protein